MITHCGLIRISLMIKDIIFFITVNHNYHLFSTYYMSDINRLTLIECLLCAKQFTSINNI